jgi:hypothetical protein
LSYTLWSLGRLVGETDFGFLASEDRQRRGWLIPTEQGEPLAAIAAGVSDAMESALEAYDLEEAAADIAAAVDRRDALELQLRGPAGNPIPVERITIRDTVVLMSVGDARFEADKSWYDSLSDEEREAFDASIDDEIDSDRRRADFAECYEELVDEGPGMVHGLPRYEITVRLVDDRAIPPLLS